MHPTLTLNDTPIRTDDVGRYCLNDLHHAAVASGANERTKEPGKFFASPQIAGLVAELETTGIPVVTIEGRNGGTYVCKELVYAYAMWINKKLYLALFKALDESSSALSDLMKALNDFEVPEDMPDMFVYAIRNTVTGNFKLGISRNPQQRLKQLQIGNDCSLELVAFRKAENRFEDERQIHLEHSGAHVLGEWFSSECEGRISAAAA